MATKTVDRQKVNGTEYMIMDSQARADILDIMAAKALAGNYASGTRIPSTDDLDDYTADGNYYINTDTDAAAIGHMPTGAKAGRLFVMHPYNSTRIMQFYIDTSTDTTRKSERIWVRRYTDSWKDWQQIITTAQFNAVIPALLTGDYAAATRIPSTGDLNDYTTDGNYYINTNNDAASIGNTPAGAKAGRLYVLHLYDSNRLLQFYADSSNDTQYGSDRIWFRRYISTASPQWREWVQIITTAQLKNASETQNAIQAGLPSASRMAYSWWVNNRVVDSYGNLYFGYISEKEYCGVGCRFPDGTIQKRDLWKSEDCDDHNAPSVILVTIEGKEYVFVVGSTGHNTDSKINAYIATQPNSITCDFTDRTHTITAPEGYTMQCSYSQAFFDSTNSKIVDFFRLKQIDNSDTSFVMIWMCAMSSDYGATWSVYRVFATGRESELFYMWGSDVSGSTVQKRMTLQTNTTNYTVRPLRAGFVNTQTLALMDESGTSINKPMTLCEDGDLAYDESVTIANYDDFTEVVPVDTQYPYKRLRILDVWNEAGSDSHLNFLYAKSVQNNQSPVTSLTDWILYRYADGTITEIAHLGMPFFRGSCYVTGACFVGDPDHVIYSKNDSDTQDGPHTLHHAVISSNAVATDRVIKKTNMTIARPARYDNGSLMYLCGKYLEDTGRKFLTWHFGIQFMDAVAID